MVATATVRLALSSPVAATALVSDRFAQSRARFKSLVLRCRAVEFRFGAGACSGRRRAVSPMRRSGRSRARRCKIRRHERIHRRAACS